MKLEPVTKLNKRNKTSKKLDDDAMLDSGYIVFKI